MPGKDQYNEILIAIIGGIIVFLAITTMVVFILLFYQKKRFQHKQLIIDMEKNFAEEILKSQLEIQEQTFNHISQEIHDNVGQVLSLAKVQINIMNESEQISHELLDGVKENVGKAMSDLRDIARSLNSDRIRTLHIHTAVSQEAERINKSGALNVVVIVKGEERMMNEQKKLILFRIVQEALQNIIKHAHATNVQLVFDYEETQLQIIIDDNGRGFNLHDALQKSSGLGISNIQNRAKLAGGSSGIKSLLEKGTTITIKMPYE